MAILYFNYNHAIKEHDNIIKLHGGLIGIKDPGLIKSVLEHIRNDDYYPTFTKKITHLVFSIAMNHSFQDGNKRSAIVLGGYFLEINGYGKIVGKFIIEMENIVLWLAEKKLNKLFLEKIITDILENGNLQDNTKLKIIKKLGMKKYPKS